MSEQGPVDYLELNLNNYCEDEVAQLNEWAIWAATKIESVTRNQRELFNYIGPLIDAWDHLPNDLKSDPELAELNKYFGGLMKHLEHGDE